MQVETESFSIKIELPLPVSRHKAWELLFSQSHIATWWGDHVTLNAQPGGTFLEEWHNGEKIVLTSGKITTYHPPEKLEMTWADDDWPGETIARFLLEKNQTGSTLSFEHSGWEIHPKNKLRELIKAHADGWSNYLSQLAEYAQTAKV